jgi:hypothetical protein
VRPYLNVKKLAYTCHSNEGGEHKIGGWSTSLARAKSQTLQNNQIKKGQRCGKAVQPQPGKNEALIQTPALPKEKKVQRSMFSIIPLSLYKKE